MTLSAESLILWPVSRFVPFGPDHLGALAVIAGSAVVAARRVAVHPRGTFAVVVRLTLALGLVTFLGFELLTAAREGWLTLEVLLPLQLCDAAILLAVVTLLTLRRAPAVLLYFWALGGTVVAALTPDLSVGFPHLEFVVFFGLHGLCIVSAGVLTFGFGLVPRAGAYWRVFLLTNVYAACVGLVNVVLKSNYLYLCQKPANPTLLDYLGPWPAYILVCELIALGVFWLLDLPFRTRRRAAARW